MDITIAAVGRMKSGPLKALWDDYAKRLSWTVALREVEEKRPLSPAKLKEREAELLRKSIPPESLLIALDASGRTLDSPAFAGRLRKWMEESGGRIGFAIGGADGLDPRFIDDASFVLSLGTMTWPHMLARIMLIEQLYRAQSILTNHPYHR